MYNITHFDLPLHLLISITWTRFFLLQCSWAKLMVKQRLEMWWEFRSFAKVMELDALFCVGFALVVSVFSGVLQWFARSMSSSVYDWVFNRLEFVSCNCSLFIGCLELVWMMTMERRGIMHSLTFLKNSSFTRNNNSLSFPFFHFFVEN